VIGNDSAMLWKICAGLVGRKPLEAAIHTGRPAAEGPDPREAGAMTPEMKDELSLYKSKSN
jgi:hypothetical protein